MMIEPILAAMTPSACVWFGWLEFHSDGLDSSNKTDTEEKMEEIQAAIDDLTTKECPTCNGKGTVKEMCDD